MSVNNSTESDVAASVKERFWRNYATMSREMMMAMFEPDEYLSKHIMGMEPLDVACFRVTMGIGTDDDWSVIGEATKKERAKRQATPPCPFEVGDWVESNNLRDEILRVYKLKYDIYEDKNKSRWVFLNRNGCPFNCDEFHVVAHDKEEK
jgi:hypothetical protein